MNHLQFCLNDKLWCLETVICYLFFFYSFRFCTSFISIMVNINFVIISSYLELPFYQVSTWYTVKCNKAFTSFHFIKLIKSIKFKYNILNVMKWSTNTRFISSNVFQLKIIQLYNHKSCVCAWIVLQISCIDLIL